MNNGKLYVDGKESAEVKPMYMGMSHTPPFILARQSHEIFMSHQRDDVEIAERLAVKLSGAGHPCYVDDMDPEVDGDSESLESYLRDVIRRSKALLAVVSSNTVGSWWVPLEIGVALDREKHVGTFLVERVVLPSYLWRWPVLRNVEEALRWADHLGKVDADEYHRRWRDSSPVPELRFVRSISF